MSKHKVGTTTQISDIRGMKAMLDGVHPGFAMLFRKPFERSLKTHEVFQVGSGIMIWIGYTPTMCKWTVQILSIYESMLASLMLFDPLWILREHIDIIFTDKCKTVYKIQGIKDSVHAILW